MIKRTIVFIVNFILKIIAGVFNNRLKPLMLGQFISSKRFNEFEYGYSPDDSDSYFVLIVFLLIISIALFIITFTWFNISPPKIGIHDPKKTGRRGPEPPWRALGPGSGSGRPGPRRPRPRIPRPPRPPVIPPNEVERWAEEDQSIVLGGFNRLRDILYLKLAIQYVHSVILERYTSNNIYNQYWPVLARLNALDKHRIAQIGIRAGPDLHYHGFYVDHYGTVKDMRTNFAPRPSLNLIFILMRNDPRSIR